MFYLWKIASWFSALLSQFVYARLAKPLPLVYLLVIVSSLSSHSFSCHQSIPHLRLEFFFCSVSWMLSTFTYPIPLLLLFQFLRLCLSLPVENPSSSLFMDTLCCVAVRCSRRESCFSTILLNDMRVCVWCIWACECNLSHHLTCVKECVAKVVKYSFIRMWY